ncbi:GMP/IMP nucleotidase [Desulforhopalus singaporensis]|uniref:Putative hydrolase of the HAD superfamily n=1 Tax=Desulforhopalus singaporensis TaxID=91360 RepID=A0A1H0JW52_9BACT|nr:GMP/IMP nucleotidase [Desulforhopalus singaporensis]SDO47830.1 putative hydrolase of the HAD superfamily [Desulforhopalus singaporensis]
MTSQTSYNKHDETTGRIAPDFSWCDIDKVFLDLDGTLLDKYFDDYFWEHFVPRTYAGKFGISEQNAREKLMATYAAVENTLYWTDLDHWSQQLELDICALKKEVSDRVALRPFVMVFLDHLQEKNKEIFLVTNAHPKTLSIKMDRIDLRDRFTGIVCSKEVGAAKEQPEFWDRLHRFIDYDKKRTLFIDDTERVLDSATRSGLGHLVHIATPSSHLGASYSATYPSISDFRELVFQ